MNVHARPIVGDVCRALDVTEGQGRLKKLPDPCGVSDARLGAS